MNAALGRVFAACEDCRRGRGKTLESSCKLQQIKQLEQFNAFQEQLGSRLGAVVAASAPEVTETLTAELREVARLGAAEAEEAEKA